MTNLDQLVQNFYDDGGEVTVCPQGPDNVRSWPIERHPWGIYNRGRQSSVFSTSLRSDTQTV
jgi:hypothetical protein